MLGSNRKFDEFGISLRRRFINLLNEAYEKNENAILTRKDLLCQFERNDHTTLGVYIHKLQESGILKKVGRANYQITAEITEENPGREVKSNVKDSSPKILRPNQAPWGWNK